MKARRGFLLTPLVLGALAGSCGSDRRGAASPSEDQATMSTADAADMLSQARCDYEVRCNRVGPTATYASREHCLDANRNESLSKFENCRHDVKRPEMQKCADEIRGGGCGGADQVVDVFEHAAACRTGHLCLE